MVQQFDQLMEHNGNGRDAHSMLLEGEKREASVPMRLQQLTGT